MTGILRLLSFLVMAAGVIAAGYLFVAAQPAESYGDVSSVVVGYGVGILIASLFWGSLGMVAAKGVDAIEDLRSKDSNDVQAGTSEELGTNQDVQFGGVTFIIIAGVIMLGVLFVIAVSAG